MVKFRQTYYLLKTKKTKAPLLSVRSLWPSKRLQRTQRERKILKQVFSR